jgi:rhomboid family GlyGly-CTERM serine protease
MRTALVVALLALACALAGAGEPFQYDRHAVDAGELWRFATSSLVHWSFDQLIWDAIGFISLAAIAASRWPARFHITLIGSALAIPIFVHFAMQEVTTYRGLSGIDSALFALVATRLLMSEARPHKIVIALCTLAFFSKITFEVVSGSTLFVRDLSPGVTALPIAHVIGAAIGLLAALLRFEDDANLRRGVVEHRAVECVDAEAECAG